MKIPKQVEKFVINFQIVYNFLSCFSQVLEDSTKNPLIQAFSVISSKMIVIAVNQLKNTEYSTEMLFLK